MNTKTETSPTAVNAIALIGILIGLLAIWGTNWHWVVQIAATLFGLGALGMVANAQDADRTEALAEWLEGGGFGWAYRRIVGRGLARIWLKVCDPVPSHAPVGSVFWAALSWRLCDFSFLLAFFYPLFAMYLIWFATGNAAQLGGLEVFRDFVHWSRDHSLSVGAIALVVWLLIESEKDRKWFGASANIAQLVLVFVLLGLFVLSQIEFISADFFFALTFVGVFYFLYHEAFAFNGSGVFVLAVAAAGAASFALEVLVPYSFSLIYGLAFLLVLIVLLGVLSEKGLSRIWLFLASGWVVFIASATAFLAPWEEMRAFNKGMFIFFGVFPLINGLFDTLSYAITLTLIRIGVRARLVPAIVWGLVDLVVASVLFFALGVTLVIVIASLNLIAGAPIFDLGSLLARIAVGLSADTAWAYLMVFSTLVPTLIHLALTLLSLERVMLPGCAKYFARLVRAGRERGIESVLAPAAAGFALMLPFLCLAGMGWVIWQFGADALVTYGEMYMRWLLMLATRIEAL